MKDGADTVLELDGVFKRHGSRMPLNGADAVFRRGRIYIVSGGAPGAQTTLARVLTGQIPVDAGRIVRRGRAAPLLGGTMGFNTGGPALRGLELRAAAFDLDHRDYVAQVAALLDNPEVLQREFKSLSAVDKSLVQFGSTYLLPSTLYVNDGPPLPREDEARERLTGLVHAALERAAIVCITRKLTTGSELGDRQMARLRDGQIDILNRKAPTPAMRRERKRKQKRQRREAERMANEEADE